MCAYHLLEWWSLKEEIVWIKWLVCRLLEPPGRGSSTSPGKRARKPYTVTRPRERWCPEEHERFLDALLR
jgi:hypothetical protein